MINENNAIQVKRVFVSERLLTDNTKTHTYLAWESIRNEKIKILKCNKNYRRPICNITYGYNMLTQNRNNIMDTMRTRIRSLLTPPSTSRPIALTSLIIFVAFFSSFTTYYTTHPTTPYPGAGGPYIISDLRVQPHVLTYNDDVLVQRFLNSHPGNVTKAIVPTFIPRLSSQCFWEKTDVKFYKRG